MRHIFKALISAAAIVAAVACAQVEEISFDETKYLTPKEMHGPVTFTASHNVESKTSIGDDFSVSWAAGDLVTVFDTEGNKEEFTVEENCERFTFTSTGILLDKGPYYAVTGYGDAVPSFDSGDRTISIRRTSTDGSFGQAWTSVAHTTGTSFAFRHVYGVLKMSVNSDDIGAMKFASGGIASANTTIGFGEDGSLDIDYGTPGNEVTIEGLSGAGTFYMPAIPGKYTGGFTIFMYFGSKAMKVASEGSFTVKYEKLLNFGTLDGGVPASTSWELVTDASSLAAGDEIIIAAADYDYALGSTQNNNNRSAAPIVKSSDKSSLSVDPDETVQVITLTAGSKSGSFGLHTDSGYLYAASSSKNYLRTQSNLDANSSWKITVSNGTTSIVAQGSNTRNQLKYNANNGSPLFSCYSSGQSAVVIYKKVSTPGSGPQMDEVNAFLDETQIGAYNYDAATDAVTPLYLYGAGRDQYAIGNNGKSFRIQCLPAGQIAGISLKAAPSSGANVSGTATLYGIDGYAGGSYEKSFTVKKAVDGKAWLQENGGTFGFIILTK